MSATLYEQTPKCVHCRGSRITLNAIGEEVILVDCAKYGIESEVGYSCFPNVCKEFKRKPIRNCDRFANNKEAEEGYKRYRMSSKDNVMSYGDWLFAEKLGLPPCALCESVV